MRGGDRQMKVWAKGVRLESGGQRELDCDPVEEKISEEKEGYESSRTDVELYENGQVYTSTGEERERIKMSGGKRQETVCVNLSKCVFLQGLLDQLN